MTGSEGGDTGGRFQAETNRPDALVPVRAETAQPFVVVCECKHIWAPFFTPLPLTLSGELLQKLVCPKCGAAASKHRVRNGIPTAQEVINANR